MVDEQDTLQVVEFVLHDAGQQSRAFALERTAFLIVGLNDDSFGTHNFLVHARNGETSFFVGNGLKTGTDDLGIDEDQGLTVFLLGDEQGQLMSDLRRGETDAPPLHHGGDHFLSQEAEFGVEFCDGNGLLPKDVGGISNNFHSRSTIPLSLGKIHPGGLY